MGEVDRREFHFGARRAQRIARARNRKFGNGADVARKRFGNAFRFFAAQHVNLPDAFFFVAVRVINGIAAF